MTIWAVVIVIIVITSTVRIWFADNKESRSFKNDLILTLVVIFVIIIYVIIINNF